MSLCKHKNVTLEQEQNPWWTYTKRTSQTKGNSPLVLTFHQKREVQYWGVLSMRSDLQIKFRRFTVPMGTLHFLLIWWFKAYHSKMPFAGLSIYLRTCLDGVHQDLEIVWVWRFWVDADSKSNFRKAWKFVFTHNSAYDVGRRWYRLQKWGFVCDFFSTSFELYFQSNFILIRQSSPKHLQNVHFIFFT